ncbi:hypothetical protein I7I51_01880 [Histoplasma capsulatum]|uniref:Uncharacterized protein n=1 Tax=Ajellomyces capsulatus TaxID=5037 RepID=A0A8A1ME80_AJECA|nr:hypothetical protein I7I51_01880 [Histoplasma capsulatum]
MAGWVERGKEKWFGSSRLPVASAIEKYSGETTGPHPYMQGTTDDVGHGFTLIIAGAMFRGRSDNDVWWVAFGSAEVFQGGNGEILLGVALMPGKKLMSGIQIPKVGNARLEVVGCPEECEVHGISKALGDDPRSVKVFCCPLYPRFCFSPAMYPGSCTGVFGGWRKEGDSKTLMHRIVQHEKVDLDRK